MYLLKICDSCVHFNPESNTCPAFPDGIPLKTDDTHFEILSNQEGDAVYDMDPEEMENFSMYRRLNPQVKFPVLITYDVPEDNELMTAQQVEESPENA